MSRTCDGCAECCKGWLPGNVMGQAFYPGRPCHFLQKTCSIYESRPVDPCKSYKCHWLDSDDLPMWMRPDMCNVIVTRKQQNGVEYFEAAECGKQIDSKVLSWLMLWALHNEKNLKYQVDGGWSSLGSKEFSELQA